MRTILVTGASRGLGFAIAERLVADEYRVICLSRTLSDDFRALMAKAPNAAFFEPFDVSNVKSIQTDVRNLTRNFGPVFGLVNNAGIGSDGVLATMHQSDIERVVVTNLLGPITLAKYVCRGMLASREGRIVNISSIIASTGFSGLSVYAASKAGIEGFSRSLARELGKMKITVNCIAPGYIETAMTKGLGETSMSSIRRRAPLGLPAPLDVAGAVAYLLSEDAARVTGTVLTVDGGSTA